jgi:hypothetical protein
MWRVLAVLAFAIALDGLGLSHAEPVCQIDQVYGLACPDAVQLAESALPSGHARVETTTLVPVMCNGYCPLIPGVPVWFRLSDGTTYTVALSLKNGGMWQEGAYAPSDLTAQLER